MDPARPSLIYERSPINETSSNSHLPCLTDQEVWDALADILALDPDALTPNRNRESDLTSEDIENIATHVVPFLNDSMHNNRIQKHTNQAFVYGEHHCIPGLALGFARLTGDPSRFVDVPGPTTSLTDMWYDYLHPGPGTSSGETQDVDIFGLDIPLVIPTEPNPLLTQFFPNKVEQVRTYPPTPRLLFDDIPTTIPADDALAPAIRALPADIRAILFEHFPDLFTAHQYWDGMTLSPFFSWATPIHSPPLTYLLPSTAAGNRVFPFITVAEVNSRKLSASWNLAVTVGLRHHKHGIISFPWFVSFAYRQFMATTHLVTAITIVGRSKETPDWQPEQESQEHRVHYGTLSNLSLGIINHCVEEINRSRAAIVGRSRRIATNDFRDGNRGTLAGITSAVENGTLHCHMPQWQAQDMNGNDITIPFTGRGIVHGLFTLLEKSDEFDFRQHFTGVPIQEPLDLTRHGLFNNSIWVNLAILDWQAVRRDIMLIAIPEFSDRGENNENVAEIKRLTALIRQTRRLFPHLFFAFEVDVLRALQKIRPIRSFPAPVISPYGIQYGPNPPYLDWRVVHSQLWSAYLDPFAGTAMQQ